MRTKWFVFLLVMAVAVLIACSEFGSKTPTESESESISEIPASDDFAAIEQGPKGMKYPEKTEGCATNVWKKYDGGWIPTGYQQNQTVKSVFSEAVRYPALGTSTLMQALSFKSGKGVQAAASGLLKEAVTAILNASHPDIDFPVTEAYVINLVNTALKSNDAKTMIANAGILLILNNQKCPNAVKVSCTSSLTITVYVNGLDADVPPGLVTTSGSQIIWTYEITNTGESLLTNVTVTDDKFGAVVTPKQELQPGETMFGSVTGTAASGQNCNTGTVTGVNPCGTTLTASDPACYLGEAIGNQGCTPGFWKNHTVHWPPTGYSSTQKVKDVFPESLFWPAISYSTLLAALGFGGGPGSDGAAEILLRAGVAALLNASHPNVNYPRTTASVLTDVNAALATHSRDSMLALAAALDADNNRGCPLN